MTTAETPDTESPEDVLLTDGFAAEKPEHDELARDQVRAKLTQQLFGEAKEPVRLGRFVILDRQGEGGMGVVYSAYDPQLDRRVALKLLSAQHRSGSSSARARLVREAQALARLSHPNVVPVHDVGVIDDRVFVVMEFVVGQTLDAWVDAEPRSWREIVEVYRQAGEGLAAAHAVDIVHRDFKPANALIGKDGRVRVVDFGLARDMAGSAGEAAIDPAPGDSAPADDARGQVAGGSDSQVAVATESISEVEAAGGDAAALALADTAPASRGKPAPGASLTAAGAVVGTPAFMSPEQMVGTKLAAASDQFSFCVSLYGALYGERPFAGRGLEQLRNNVLSGRLRDPPKSSRVPGWVHAIVCRGLQTDPTDRYPTMAALLADLGRDRARARRRWAVALAFVGLAGALGIPLVRGATTRSIEPCQGAERELADVWNDGLRERVARAVEGTAASEAQALSIQLSARLDDYADEWAAMHRQACMAHQRGQQSGRLLDRRMACLERRRVALDSAVGVLAEVDDTSIVNALQVVSRLPGIGHCGDLEALEAEVPPPEDPTVAARVDALRGRLSRAKALEDAGRHPEALALAESLVVESEATGYPPLHAESLLLEGRVLLASREQERSIEPLRQASLIAISVGADSLAIEALARRVFSEGHTHPDDALDDLPLIEAISRRVPHDGFGRALLFNNVGATYVVRGERAKARDYLERALAIRDRAGEHVELSAIPLNLANLTADEGRRVALMRMTVDERVAGLGATHPSTLYAQVRYSHAVIDPAMARSILAPACASYQALYPERVTDRVFCDYSLAVLDAELNDPERAAARMHRVAALAAGENVPFLTRHGKLAAGWAHLHEGDYRAALRPLTEALAAWRRFAPDPAWYIELRMAHAQLAVGIGQYYLGRHREAVSALERALATFEEHAASNSDVEHDRLRAWTWAALGQALWDAGDLAVRERAVALIAKAEAWYRAAGAGYAWRLEQLAAWRVARAVRE